MYWGKNIQLLCRQRRITQEKLEELEAVSQQNVSKWESEQSTPDLNKIIVMSDLFEVTTDYMFRGQNLFLSQVKNAQYPILGVCVDFFHRCRNMVLCSEPF